MLFMKKPVVVLVERRYLKPIPRKIAAASNNLRKSFGAN
jgi:ribosomal protein S17